MLLIEWSNECNMDGVIYEKGFEGQFIVRPFYDAPNIVREEPANINNTAGTLRIKRSVQKQFCVFEVCDIPDALLNTLYCIRDHSKITVTDLETCERLQVLEFQFSHRNQDDCYNVGRFQIHVDSKVKTSCCKKGAVQVV